MARAMPHYHLDLLCEEGALMGSIEFECTDDQTAKGHAQTVLSGYGGELWRRIDPDSPVDGNGHTGLRANE